MPVSSTNPVYFVYTMNNIPTVGGVTPQGVEIGLGNYKNIYAGKAIDSLLLISISEFNPIIISKDEAFGLSLVGITKMPVIDPSTPTGTKTRVLNAAEKRQQLAATELIRKLRIRTEVKSSIGDTDDLLADVSRRVSMIERVTMYYLNSVLNTVPIPAANLTEYKALVTSYIANVENGTFKDPSDLEVTADLFTKLSNRITSVANIITNTK